MSGDEREDRPRRSWREIDQMRDGTRSREDRPRNRAEEARVREATRQYVKEEADKLFSSGSGGAEGAALANAVRDAHGSSELAGACRAYREAVGMPKDPSLLSIFLDSSDSELIVAALKALTVLQQLGELEVASGLRSQLRMLAQGFDDASAEAAEELLEEL